MRSRQWVAVMMFSVLSSITAHAQNNCFDVYQDMKNRLVAGQSVYVYMTTLQANKITTSTMGIKMAWDSVNARLSSFPSPGNQAPMRFNDRLNTSYPNQNFSDQTAATEDIDLDIWLTSAGTVSAAARNLKWNFWLSIPTLTCYAAAGQPYPASSIMTGFGSPIGNANGNNSASYALTYVVVP